jgi:hypothetical protein
LSKPWLHAAFILLLVGYGTKMGLAPMHTWKPDAYGEAPGVVGALLGGPHKRAIHFAETLAGDTTIAHALAYCQALEALARCRKSARAQALRGIALELERLANHVGDLGALANDVGYLPTASYCGRLRGDFLNLTALLCGSRFGRGMVRPGGVGFDVDAERVAQLLRQLDLAEKDINVAVALLWDTPSVMARFEDTGTLPRPVALELGLVGPAARASGLARDVRQDQPCGIFRFAQIPVSSYDTGDVFARAPPPWCRWTCTFPVARRIRLRFSTACFGSSAGFRTAVDGPNGLKERRLFESRPYHRLLRRSFCLRIRAMSFTRALVWGEIRNSISSVNSRRARNRFSARWRSRAHLTTINSPSRS